MTAAAHHARDDARKRPTILVFARYYLPGYKEGGPAKSVNNIVEALGSEFSFRIVTSDRDRGDTEPYPGVPINRWASMGSADVYYAAPGPGRVMRTVALLRQTPHDLVYLNSFFDRGFSMWPLLLWRVGVTRAPLLLAPRGEFSQGALAIKPRRKRSYLWLAKRLGLYRGVRWHISTAAEGLDLDAVLDRAGPRHVAAPLAEGQRGNRGNAAKRRAGAKQPGRLRIVFVSRIVRKKNLGYALRVLGGVSGELHLDIYGPLEDKAYWRECQALIVSLPHNITAEYRGSLPPAQVKKVFAEADLFFLPTLGENFGHVVAEALAEGCPVLLSDQTPWNGVQEAGAGWAFPLSDVEAFRATVQRCVALDSIAFESLAAAALRYAELVTTSGVSVVDQNRAMLQEAARLAFRD